MTPQQRVMPAGRLPSTCVCRNQFPSTYGIQAGSWHMRPDTSNWRNRESYDSFEALPVEGLAWECLRRCEPYQQYYQELVAANTENAPLPEEAQRRWGLRFPGAAQPFLFVSTGALDTFCRSECGAFYAAP
ncbi:transcriptional regulator domain-containing protein [Phyllobacterium phragmitis]|uniref:transcriptional regulator domain-containing protein n=1 Tax=Phyllobacterium phragmitis TaxID=2670329 RepID=UPI0038B23A0D